MSAREVFLKAFQAARKVRIGNKLYVGNSQEVEPRIKRALAEGKTVSENGVDSWIDFAIVFDSTKSPRSAGYLWKGDKVKYTKTLCTRVRGGVVTRQPAGFCYMEWE